MELQRKEPQPFRLENPRQQRIYRRLSLIGRGPVAFYLDACRLMSQSTYLASTSHLIAHLFREIESALRDVLETIGEHEARLKAKGPSKDNHEREIRAILGSLGIPESDPVAQLWLGLAGMGNTAGLASRAHRDSLSMPRSVDTHFRQFWDEAETILDLVLEKLESRYLDYIRVLDELLAKSSPSHEDVSRLRNHMPNSLVAHGYFFEKLASPAWLGPLKQQEGFFKSPPLPEIDQERGTIRVPLWPQSRYLVRVASLKPQEVLDIALEIETENPRVHEDLVEAALAMPAEISAKLTPKVLAWIENPYSPFWPEKFGELVGHLAKGNQVEPAVTLAQTLLAVLPGEGGLSKARARFDAWHYEHILQKHLPDLVAAAKVRALTLLCDLLQTAVELSCEQGDEGGGEDYSYIWRRAIEGERRRGFHEIRDLLVSAARDASIQIVRTDQTLLASVLDELERRPWKIFHRIAFHVLRFFPGTELDLVRSRLISRTLFEDRGIQREYALLLRDRFGSLPVDDQREILSWVAQGPDLEKYRERRKAWGEQPITTKGLNADSCG